ncbi:hypothetical protein [Telluribacter humicola]|uniref:hypothetical protein n=1 Tax=Telluribacter humicola TaxID=1720261 RepID=UPI001A9587B3|nr:hypothetical protein [Telluribacter humicola]
MKTLKLLTVLLLISLQVSATGYSHNMFVAQKMLKAKKEVRKAAPKTREISQASVNVTPTTVTSTRATPSGGAVVKATPSTSPASDDQDEVTTSNLTPAAFTQHLARWIVGFVCCERSNDDEKASGESDEEPSLGSHLVTLVKHVVFSLV